MTAQSTRHGFALVFVLIAVTVAALATFAFTAEGLQALRGERGTTAAADAAGAADAAQAQALARYADDSLWTLPLGQQQAATETINRIDVRTVWQRQQPLVATLRATARFQRGAAHERVQREHIRAVWLAPPDLPIQATLTTNGPLVGREGTLLSGSDIALPGSPCSARRDTLSVLPLTAIRVEEAFVGSWPGAPRVSMPDSNLFTRFAAALRITAARAPAERIGAAPRAFPRQRDWSVVHWQADTVTVTGPTRFTGLVIVQGRLTLIGDVHVTGLLVVAGPLNASSARFSVQGAVVAADTSASGVMLGGNSHLFYDQCAVQMALATVARPSLAPFSLWQSLSR